MTVRSRYPAPRSKSSYIIESMVSKQVCSSIISNFIDGLRVVTNSTIVVSLHIHQNQSIQHAIHAY